MLFAGSAALCVYVCFCEMQDYHEVVCSKYSNGNDAKQINQQSRAVTEKYEASGKIQINNYLEIAPQSRRYFGVMMRNCEQEKTVLIGFLLINKCQIC